MSYKSSGCSLVQTEAFFDLQTALDESNQVLILNEAEYGSLEQALGITQLRVHLLCIFTNNNNGLTL